MTSQHGGSLVRGGFWENPRACSLLRRKGWLGTSQMCNDWNKLATYYGITNNIFIAHLTQLLKDTENTKYRVATQNGTLKYSERKGFDLQILCTYELYNAFFPCQHSRETYLHTSSCCFQAWNLSHKCNKTSLEYFHIPGSTAPLRLADIHRYLQCTKWFPLTNKELVKFSHHWCTYGDFYCFNPFSARVESDFIKTRRLLNPELSDET